jgi:FMN phosphatase YigB (HAD superfamily)
MRASEIQPKKLIVFDIDDTLVHTQTKVHVIKDNKVVNSLNSHDFTHYKLKPGERFDFKDFRNAREFFEKSKPIIPMMRQLKQDIATGNKVVMVTARADFDDKDLFLDTFRKYGVDMSKVHVYRAGNNKQGTTEERKKSIIKTLLDKGNYNKAIMYDDAIPNLHTFIELKQDHPKTKFYAWHVSLEGKASEYMREDFVAEKKKRKRKPRLAVYGPGPYGGYGFFAGYSGDSGGAGDGGGVGEDVLKELFDPKLAIDLEWAEGSDYVAARGYVTVTNPNGYGGEYGNEEEVELEIEFGEYPHPQRKEYEVQFKVDESFAITGGGNTSVIFATVIQACKDFVEMYKPDRLFFTADEQSRARMYDTITKRVAKQVGWHVLPFDEIQKDPLYRHKSGNGFMFVIAKGEAPEKFQSSQKPQHGSWMPIWFVYNLDKDTPTVAVKVRAPDRVAAVAHARKIEPSFKDLDSMQIHALSSLPKREVTAVIDGGTAGEEKKVKENFADGKVKGKSRPGRVKRAGASCAGSVTDLRSRAKNASGEKAKMYHWCANMKSGRNK